MIDINQAIISLVPDATFKVEYPELNIVWMDPVEAPVTREQIEAELARLQKEYDDKEYQRQRAEAYPSVVDQLDLLYHGGYDAWKAAIDAVKQEYPKP